MLILCPEVTEKIILYDRDTKRCFAIIKPFFKNGNDRLRLAFEIPPEVQVTREPIVTGRSRDAQRTG